MEEIGLSGSKASYGQTISTKTNNNKYTYTTHTVDHELIKLTPSQTALVIGAAVYPSLAPVAVKGIAGGIVPSTP